MALLTHVVPTALQVLTAVSKITYAEAKIFNLLAVDHFEQLRPLWCQRRGTSRVWIYAD